MYAARQAASDHEGRGVYVDRALGIVRSVTSYGDVTHRFITKPNDPTYHERVDIAIADAEAELDRDDPPTRSPAPSHLRLLA